MFCLWFYSGIERSWTMFQKRDRTLLPGADVGTTKGKNCLGENITYVRCRHSYALLNVFEPFFSWARVGCAHRFRWIRTGYGVWRGECPERRVCLHCNFEASVENNGNLSFSLSLSALSRSLVTVLLTLPCFLFCPKLFPFVSQSFAQGPWNLKWDSCLEPVLFFIRLALAHSE